MAYKPHTLIAFGGRLADNLAGGTEEVWQCGVRGVQADNTDHTVNNPAGLLAGIASPLASWFADPINLMSVGAFLDYVKVNNIGANGKYQDPSHPNTHLYTPGVQGGAAATQPDILTICWSWRTALRGNGPGVHGRIYPPNNTTGSAVAMAIGGADRDRHLAAARRLLGIFNIGDGDSAAMLPVVASGVNATNTLVTEIWIGSIVDVQRRRKSAEVELYTKGPVFV